MKALTQFCPLSNNNDYDDRNNNDNEDNRDNDDRDDDCDGIFSIFVCSEALPAFSEALSAGRALDPIGRASEQGRKA